MRAGAFRGRCRAAIAWASAVSVVAMATSTIAPHAGAASSGHVLRYPYLTDTTPNTALVNFATDAASPAPVVTFGPAGGTCATSSATASGTAITVNGTSETQFQATLTGLSGNTEYCYRVVQNGVDLLGTDASPTFTTAAAPGDNTPYSFAVIGDWGAGSPDEANVLAQIASSPAKFVVTVGDNAYNSGTQSEYGDLSSGNVFAANYWKDVGAGRPVYAAQGNHGFTGYQPYLRNFPQPNVVRASGGRLQPDTYCCIPPMASTHTYASAWYAFDWGPARYYVLEAAWADGQGAYAGDFYAHWNGPVPGCPACGTELQWLESDLAAHTSTPFKFAFFHYPLYSDAPTQSSDTYLQGPKGLEGLLAKNDVNIVFNGHAHNYERNYPQIPGSPMVSYVTGGGGDALGSIGCSAFDAYAVGTGRTCRAPAPTSSAQVFHFLLVTINGGTVTVTPTDSTGRTFDVQTYTTNTANVTTIDSAPPALTSSTTATFTFHSTAPNATFMCALDGGTESACSSPATFDALAPGSHTLTVVTAASNSTSPAPVSSTWMVDTSPPSTPTGVTATAVSGTQVDVSWVASADDTGVVGYDIARDGAAVGSVGGGTTTFSDATASPSTTYQYTVVARDGAGNPSPPSTPAPVTTPAQTATTPKLVQSAGSSTTTVTFPTPTTAGNLLVLSAGVYTGTTKPITAVSDGKNTWTKVGAFAVSGANSDGEMWYAANATPVTSITVTTGAAAVALSAQEFSGIATTNPLDVSGGTANKGTTASAGPVTPTATDDLAVGFAAGHASTQAMTVNAPGYTALRQQTTSASNTTSVVTGYQAPTPAAAQTFNASFGSAMYWSSGVATFKAASAPPRPPPPPPPPPADDFSVAANPTTVTITAGQSTTTTIATTLTSGAAQSITLSAGGLPSGATASFNPPTINSGQGSTMTISTTSATPAGSSTVAVTATGTTATHSTSVGLTVTAPVTGSTPRLVQSAGSTSGTVTFPTSTTAGSLLVLSAGVYTGLTKQITAVSDGKNTWTKIGAFAVSGKNSDGEIWYAANAAPVTSITVTTGAAAVALQAQEFSGVAATAPLDVSIGASNSGTSATSGSVAPAGTNDLVVGFVAGHASTQPITITSPGFTVEAQQTAGSGSTTASVVTGYQTLNAATAQTFSGTFTASMNWAAAVVCFRAAA